MRTMYSWQVVTIAGLAIAGAVVAYALGGETLATALGALAGGILIPTSVRGSQ